MNTTLKFKKIVKFTNPFSLTAPSRKSKNAQAKPLINRTTFLTKK